jgi:4-hydroxy-tetrahydrodipicolinate synthase
MYQLMNLNWTCTIASLHDGLMTELAGLYVPLITPFSADGGLATTALEQLAHRVLDDGAAGLVALGTTAEAATLTESERAEVLGICDRVCQDRGVPLIAGAGTNDTARSAADLASLACYPHVRAALTVVPYYSRPGEAGVLEHFRALAAMSPVPLLVYNIPYRTGQALSWPSLRQIAGLPGVAGIKHAVGSIDRDTVAMMAGRPPGFAVLGGDDEFVAPLLALGADGAILAAAHLRTAEFARLIRLWRDGAVAPARQLGHRLAEVARAVFAEPNPVVIKAVLYRLGQIPTPAVRLPLVAASPTAATAAAAVATCAAAD